MGDQALHELPEKLAITAQVVGTTVASGSGFGAWVYENHETIWAVGIFGGMFVGVAGLLVGWYYKAQHLKLAKKQLWKN